MINAGRDKIVRVRCHDVIVFLGCFDTFFQHLFNLQLSPRISNKIFESALHWSRRFIIIYPLHWSWISLQAPWWRGFRFSSVPSPLSFEVDCYQSHLAIFFVFDSLGVWGVLLSVLDRHKHILCHNFFEYRNKIDFLFCFRVSLGVSCWSLTNGCPLPKNI